MTIRSVLALIDGGSTSEQALKAAIQVGLAFDAHVEVLHVEPPLTPLVPVMPEGVSGVSAVQLADDIETDVRMRSEHAKTLFDRLCTSAGLKVIDPEEERYAIASFAWRLVNGHDNPELARRGRLVDLIVMGRPDAADGGVDSAALEAALFDTARPVLIAGNAELEINDAHMVIAWDGSREVARSLGAALPFLKLAKTVEIISVNDNHTQPDLKGLQTFLCGHGVETNTHVIGKEDRTIAETLHHQLLSQKVGLSIMGAYGHSVIGEFLFGGVTRDMLKDQHLPLFLAH
jgi:nucleotide-binding universal stress UspA family protein